MPNLNLRLLPQGEMLRSPKRRRARKNAGATAASAKDEEARSSKNLQTAAFASAPSPATLILPPSLARGEIFFLDEKPPGDLARAGC